MITEFVAARNGGVMAKVEGIVAFPEKKGPQPKEGEEWEVEVAGSNPSGTVKFLRLIRRIGGESESEVTDFLARARKLVVSSCPEGTTLQYEIEERGGVTRQSPPPRGPRRGPLPSEWRRSADNRGTPTDDPDLEWNPGLVGQGANRKEKVKKTEGEPLPLCGQGILVALDKRGVHKVDPLAPFGMWIHIPSPGGPWRQGTCKWGEFVPYTLSTFARHEEFLKSWKEELQQDLLQVLEEPELLEAKVRQYSWNEVRHSLAPGGGVGEDSGSDQVTEYWIGKKQILESEFKWIKNELGL